jgi:DNA-directed RNA polymerase subunit E'/Rpb7
MPPKKIDTKNNNNDSSLSNDIIKSSKNSKKITNSDNNNETQTNIDEKNDSLQTNKLTLNPLNNTEIIYPYKNIVLAAPVIIDPIQLNGRFEYNIKKNLINSLEGSCYKDYGFITKIYKIETYTKPIIEPESMTCTPITNVKFVHELCMPINNKFIICKITQIVKELIRCENGPILSFISSDRINPEVFYKDSNRNFRTKNVDYPYLVKDLFVKIYIIGSNLNFDKNIIAIGALHDLATDEETKLYYKHI